MRPVLPMPRSWRPARAVLHSAHNSSCPREQILRRRDRATAAPTRSSHRTACPWDWPCRRRDRRRTSRPWCRHHTIGAPRGRENSRSCGHSQRVLLTPRWWDCSTHRDQRAGSLTRGFATRSKSGSVVINVGSRSRAAADSHVGCDRGPLPPPPSPDLSMHR